MTARKKLRILVITMGCSKNLVDSEHLMRQFDSYGMELLPSDYSIDITASKDSADRFIDCIIINTCGFIQDAKEESISMIFKALAAKKTGKAGKVLVFGCLSQRYLSELKEGIPEVDAFFGAFNIKDVVEYLGLDYRPELCSSRYQTTPEHYAYLKISEGCNRRCAYCAIPFIRGPHVSVPMEELEREARELAAKGVKELIVIAQDTTYYGLDLYGKRMLAPLLERLSAVKGIEWIRIHYSYPDDFPEDVIELMAVNPKICKYLDIPLQHGSNSVLKNMHRGIGSAQTQKLIDSLRQRIPGIVLRTTLIVGFPGETSRDFNTLLEFVARNRFERLGAFTYSEEEGTYAAEHYKDNVRQSTKQKRYDRLMELQSSISAKANEARLGKIEKVLVDRMESDFLVARSQYESPEVDGEILIPLSSCRKVFGNLNLESLIGKFVDVRIVDSDEYDLYADPVLSN
ncbi:MAG: 30S ribosomal protein S12 methylthiotransferase RimO [Bacteroidales bacterium]|nr:30S ribosomal protein S12 methylthiotransferase RimO [Candidatus Egerieousia equi]